MKKGFVIAAAIVVALAAAPSGNAAPVSMSFVGNINQTRVFRGDLTGLGLTTLDAAKVCDTGVSGADGVFTGFDLDFILLDGDGDLTTTDDQVLPFETAATTVTPGTVVTPTIYAPTAAHPGVLFGLNTDVSIDFDTATIGTLDASFANPLAVNTSDGWVTLGRGGTLDAAFPETSIGSSLWIFVGEVGPATAEGMLATCVEVSNRIPAPGALVLCAFGATAVTWLRSRRIV